MFYGPKEQTIILILSLAYSLVEGEKGEKEEKDKYLCGFWEGGNFFLFSFFFLKLLRSVAGKPLVTACVDGKGNCVIGPDTDDWRTVVHFLLWIKNSGEHIFDIWFAAASLLSSLWCSCGCFHKVDSVRTWSFHSCLWTGSTGHILAQSYSAPGCLSQGDNILPTCI